jgi:hypothetical protein
MAFNWLYLVDPVIAYFIDNLPRQKPEKGTVEAQNAAEGNAVAVVYGTRDITMNIVYDGASTAIPYKKSGGKK